MRRLTMAPETANHVRYHTPHMDVVVIRAHATDPVNVLVLDPRNYSAYEQGAPFRPTAASRNRLNHEMAVRVPSLREWFLTIENPTESITDVEFEVIEQIAGSPTGASGILSGSIFNR